MFQRHPAQNDCMMFITTNLQKRRRLFENPAFAREAIETLYRIQEFYPFQLYAFVFMPDHCHMLIHIESPRTVSELMRKFKMGTSKNIGIGPIWQTRFYLVVPKDNYEIRKYIHLNPVRAGICEESTDYPWSSASGKWPVQDL